MTFSCLSPSYKNRNFLQPVIDDIHDQKIPVLRAYYENICKICRVIIEDIGITLTEPGEYIKLLSFIINMEHTSLSGISYSSLEKRTTFLVKIIGFKMVTRRESASF